MPTAVEAWKADLRAKNRGKLADTIANPTANPEAFEEGWDVALEREAGALSLTDSGVKVNGS
jgi:coatomer subunit beta'